MAQTNCESCMNYEYDEEYDYYVCMKNLDEDEMYRFVRENFGIARTISSETNIRL